MQPAFFKGYGDLSAVLFQFLYCALRRAKIAADQKKHRAFFGNRILRLALDRSECACGEGMESDRRMCGRARRSSIGQILLRLATSRIEIAPSQMRFITGRHSTA